ncbi:MAG TPA: hypothetical protein VMZ53_16355 [Kofleriaceae bacterium]|nr:hypothetical protein [Kofleriaceae bacterium]
MDLWSAAERIRDARVFLILFDPAAPACQTHYKNHPNGTLVEDRD